MSTEGLSAEREDAPVVLIVEDEQDLAELYATGLGEPYAVRTAFDGEQALEQLDETVDVVLLDRRMPKLSGDEVLDRIREGGFDCRVVMVSAVEPDFDVLEMGFDDYVSKPVSAADLRETVDRMLELATHDPTLQEYHALVSKKIALEAKKSLRELAESEEYAELKAEIDDLRGQLDAERADLQEALASAAVFQGLDSSGPASGEPSTDAPSLDDGNERPGADTSPESAAETEEGTDAGAEEEADVETGGETGDEADVGTEAESVEGADAETGEEAGDGTDVEPREDDEADAASDVDADDDSADEPDAGSSPAAGAGPEPSLPEPVASADGLLRGVPEALLVEDADRNVVDCNPAFAELFGYEREALAGESTANLYDRVEQFESMGQRLRTLADGATERATVAFQASDGTAFTGEAAVGVRRDAAGEVAAFVWVVREGGETPAEDRTPDTTAEELAVLNRLLRHDISNDMAIASGWLELLREEVTADQRELLDRAIAATDHSIELTHAVGDLVRAIDEPEALELETVSLDDVVEREVEKGRETYDDATITVEDLPPVEVRANDLVSSVVGNLLRNAVQHNDAADPRVDLSVEVGFHTATLRVADNGPGIPEERRETLFEQGQKGAESDGLGIGLSLVKRLVDVYDGTIRIEDNEPRGTVVAVELAKAE